MELLYAVIGLVILVLAGDALVRGAVNMSLRLGIPPLIVGLTVVAFGTSAPELLVSIKAVLDNAPGIALGNVVGSNIANILLVLGVPAIVSTIHSGESDTQRSYLMMIAATVLFMVLCWMGPITWVHALILLAGLGWMLSDSYRSAQAHRRTETANGDTANGDGADTLEGADPSMPWWKIGAFMAVGLIGLPLGADLLVESAVVIARSIGVSETVIGLTLIAVGTSLPELATSVVAALRRQADVALGNVIGSNMFNLLGIVGVAGLVGDLPVPASLLQSDLWVMLGASLLLAPFVLMGRNITRPVGIGLTGAYLTYLATLIL